MSDARKPERDAPAEAGVEPLGFDARWVAGGLNPQPLPPRHDDF